MSINYDKVVECKGVGVCKCADAHIHAHTYCISPTKYIAKTL